MKPKPVITHDQTPDVAKLLGIDIENLYSLKITPKHVRLIYYHVNAEGRRYFLPGTETIAKYTRTISIED